MFAKYAQKSRRSTFMSMDLRARMRVRFTCHVCVWAVQKLVEKKK